ncbi:hypothetical protein V7S78_08425 [Aquirufa regiilacus]
MRFFKIIHFLSLDVVFGAISLHIMFFHAFVHAWPRWEYDALLGISVFLIYGIDRLIDNRTANVPDDLHLFHAQNQRLLIYSMSILGVINAILLCQVEIAVFGIGIGLLFVLIAYWLAWVKGVFEKIWGTKEIFTSLIYCLGILLPTSLYVTIPFVIGIALFLLVLLNLWLFTLISQGGQRKYVTCISYLSLISLLVVGASGFPVSLVGILLFIWGIQVGIYYFRAQMNMRPWAEWAFASPLIYVLCNL